MKHILLTALVVFLTLPSFAQEEEEIDLDLPAATTNTTAAKPKIRRLENWNLGVSLMQWSEEMRLRQFGVTTTSVANLNGFLISAQKDFTYLRWGWSMSGYLGSGRANGGTPPTYDGNKVAFTVLGVSARTFWRLSGRINFGITGMVFNRLLEWPDGTNVTAESGKNPNVTAIADLNLRLAKDWELYQGIGPMGPSQTLWRVGLNYRF